MSDAQPGANAGSGMRAGSLQAWGVASVLAALAYMGSPRPIAYTAYGELTVFVFFGLVAVIGTDWVLTGGAGWLTLLAAVAIGNLATAALAVNSLRDIAHDRGVGHRTFCVAFGAAASPRLFGALLLSPFALAPAMALQSRSTALLLPLLLLPRAMRTRRSLITCPPGVAFNAVLFQAFRLELWYAALLAVGALCARMGTAWQGDLPYAGRMQQPKEVNDAQLPPAVSGERFDTRGRAGRVACYVAGSGPPLLLVHSVNAAASAAEVRPLHEHYRESRTVYSIDLPGFGASERSDRVYSPRLMTDALLQVRDAIAARGHAGPVDALAVSTGCEFLARAASELPERFRRLALVSPTGLRGSVARRGPAGATRALPWLYRALRGPGWGGALYRGLTRPTVIRYFLGRTWGSKAIDEQLWAYDVLTARLPGAEHAPLYFLSAALFSADILSVYESLQQPVWLSHGVRGDFTDYGGRHWLEARGNWRFSVYPTGALPYFELPQGFIGDFDGFLGAG